MGGKERSELSKYRSGYPTMTMRQCACSWKQLSTSHMKLDTGLEGSKGDNTYHFHGRVDRNARNTLFEVLRARKYFREREYTYEVQIAGMEDYD